MANPVSSVSTIAYTYATAASTTIADTRTISLSTGDWLIAFVGIGGSQSMVSFTDNSGVTGTWTADYIAPILALSQRTAIYRTRVASNLSTGSVTFTATSSSSSSFRQLVVVKMSGSGSPPQWLVPKLDQQNISAPTTSTISGTVNGANWDYTVPTGSITPTVGDEIVFSFVRANANQVGSSASSGYSLLTTSTFVNYLYLAYALQGDTLASTSPSITWTCNTAIATVQYGTISYSVLPYDPGLGTDSVNSNFWALSGADTGTGADTTDGFTWSLSSSDGSSGVDTASVVFIINPSVNDAGSGTDSLAIERGAFDAGSGANSASVVVSLSPFVNDAGSGNDSSGITIIETISAGDYGNGFETVNAVIPKPYFTPPTVKDIAPYLPDSSGLQVRLFRHYATRYRGVNVFLLSDGTFVQDTATVENGNTGYPLPWIINDPANEYLTVFNIDGSVTNTLLNPHIAKVYEGGHRHSLTQDEAVALAAAGYYVEYV